MDTASDSAGTEARPVEPTSTWTAGTHGRSASARAAGWVFVAALVVAFPLYLWRGNEQWFFLDEWDYLAARSLSISDLLRPHNEHWTTLPIVVYRVLWRFVGLRSYVPYQVIIVALQLGAAVLLRRIMRRAGVGPWVATTAASIFLFLGSGRQNIIWAFQIGFVGALVCGLAHLILSDHDGPPDRRDAFGIAIGAVGLLCSGVAVTMVIVVGLAVLIRRGWWAALVNTLPLAAIYAVWYAAYGADAKTSVTGRISAVGEFVTTGIGTAFAEIGHLPFVGLLLGALLVVGLVMAWTQGPLTRVRRRAAVPAAMLVGAVVFLVIAGYGRAAFLGTDAARASRYVHIVAALVLPAIAVAADALVRRSRLLVPIVFVLLLVGIPGNISEIRPTGFDRYGLGDQTIMNLVRSPFARQVPRSLRPYAQAHEVTMGWLLDGARSGRIPRQSDLPPDDIARATLRLVLHQSTARVAASGCVSVTAPLTESVERGDVLVFRGLGLATRTPLADGRPSTPVVFLSRSGSTIRVEAGPLPVTFSSAFPTQPVQLCRGG